MEEISNTYSLTEAKVAKMERDPVKTVIMASMIGTAIEFFDFYAYGTAAATYFPNVFFPSVTPTIAMILSLLTFGVAFVARPLGSLLFGHFGDKLGRKRALVVSLLMMGLSTVVIGFLPGYRTLGMTAILLLCLARFTQGIGLGGEWSGAVLVATENAPKGKRALFGSFTELGAPIGFFLSNGLYVILETVLTKSQMVEFGWRVPFVASAVLVVFGLWVRRKMQETPLFRLAQKRDNVKKAPLAQVFTKSWKQILQGTFIMAVSYTFFFLLSTWSLSYGTAVLGFDSREFLMLLMGSIVVFAGMIVYSSILSDRFGRRTVLLAGTAAIFVFSFVFPFFFQGHQNVVGTLFFLLVGFLAMGVIYGPVGAMLPELFPTSTRYSGAGIAYNMSAIVGAAFAPTIASWLVGQWGIHAVGYYLAFMSLVSIVALLLTKETKSVDYTK
ncbi:MULTISPECIES: MFS transporter [Lactiplantibacillus]|jgi:metabolite-proton symporter|uniref:MFS transporter n=1 Tax=Lactiplantibacillus TaxID=2767842 RepID=UPI00059B1553|nr:MULTISPECIES: MFS transporter [Lactiplantibacillus]RRG00965.1 MAG: MFS transporter [Lactobacillus sp.]KIN18916.1 MFS transporter [Lactiplantibacillus plantarum]KZU86419.1 transmembrane transport protein forshikimate [Lactiplantibacillus plantarum]MCT0221909.1 MFS transporter [Lactiplantibacillus plantarum]MCW6152426.1 MHS family MFS transporter [Lactiplantibacillus plantarum]